MNVSDFPLYHYRAHVLSVHDGDTFTAEVQLGLRVSRTLTIRINGIDAPELYGDTKAAGLAARDRLATMVSDTDVYLETDHDKKSFDRWIARLYITDPNGDLIDVGQKLIDDGYAVVWKG